MASHKCHEKNSKHYMIKYKRGCNFLLDLIVGMYLPVFNQFIAAKENLEVLQTSCVSLTF